MKTNLGGSSRWIVGGLALLLALMGMAMPVSGGEPILVAASEPDIEAIVKEVGGDQVGTFVLFKGCILRSHLDVDPEVIPRLATADAIIWTGFIPEAAAVRLAVGNLPQNAEKEAWNPSWINLSKHARQVDPAVATATGYCGGDGYEYTTHGDPFFRLDPENGAIMAKDIAEGLAQLRPGSRALFEGNAKAFSERVAQAISRWKEALKPLASLRVFCTQCGWENFARLGGPELLVCKKKPGCCPTPDALVKHVQEMKVQVVLIDPHTRPNHADAIRKIPKVIVADVPSSIGDLPGATRYEVVFDRFVEVLKKCSQEEQKTGEPAKEK